MKRGSLIVPVSFALMFGFVIVAGIFRFSGKAEASPLATINPQVSNTPLATVTEYATPSPTLRSVETVQAELAAAREAEYQTRLQLAALIEDHAQVTAEHERNVIEIARLTESAMSLEVKAAELTATVIPVMATEAEAVRIYQLQQNQFAKEYPAIIREKAESEAYANSAQAITAAEVFLRFVFGFTVIVLLSLLVFVVVYRGGNKKESVKEAQPAGLVVDLGALERQEAQRQIFFRPAVNEQKEPVQKRMKLEIPCPLDEFLQFAEGIIRLNQKLAFASWRGSPVYRYLNSLRRWMEGEGFAEPIPNHTDEMTVTADGEKFLTESLAADEPIAPYYCKDTKQQQKEHQT